MTNSPTLERLLRQRGPPLRRRRVAPRCRRGVRPSSTGASRWSTSTTAGAIPTGRVLAADKIAEAINNFDPDVINHIRDPVAMVPRLFPAS